MDHLQQLCLPEDMNIHLLVDCTSYFDVNKGIPGFLTYFDPLPNDFKWTFDDDFSTLLSLLFPVKGDILY